MKNKSNSKKNIKEENIDIIEESGLFDDFLIINKKENKTENKPENNSEIKPDNISEEKPENNSEKNSEIRPENKSENTPENNNNQINEESNDINQILKDWVLLDYPNIKLNNKKKKSRFFDFFKEIEEKLSKKKSSNSKEEEEEKINNKVDNNNSIFSSTSIKNDSMTKSSSTPSNNQSTDFDSKILEGSSINEKEIDNINISNSLSNSSINQANENKNNNNASNNNNNQIIDSNEKNEEKNYILDINKVISLEDQRTTIMIKNIPNKFNKELLLSIINQNFKGTYDLFILPTDINKYKNFGYSFINFTSSYYIPYFYFMFNGKMWSSTNSRKVCELTYSKVQGKNDLLAHYPSKIIHCNEEAFSVTPEQQYIIPNVYKLVFNKFFPKEKIEEYKFYFITKIPGHN